VESKIETILREDVFPLLPGMKDDIVNATVKLFPAWANISKKILQRKRIPTNKRVQKYKRVQKDKHVQKDKRVQKHDEQLQDEEVLLNRERKRKYKALLKILEKAKKHAQRLAQQRELQWILKEGPPKERYDTKMKETLEEYEVKKPMLKDKQTRTINKA